MFLGIEPEAPKRGCNFSSCTVLNNSGIVNFDDLGGLMALDLEFSVAAGVTTAILLLILSYKLLLQSFLYWNKRGVPQVGALEVNTRFKDALLSRIHISQVFAFIYK
uniref:Uncharacterized protein n=1 Tax=Timema cristinae TaxID=61476 RepID=A0A7R9H6R2_TIMCR|nr:unnamed protein product [Timema cristinae]